jgi:CDP-glucose 4,6-dehydratase
VTAAYRNSFFNERQSQGANHTVGLATARAGNVIGGGDWSNDRLLPDLLHALSQQHPIELRNPTSIRPWQHVLEPLSGYLSLAQALYESPHSYSEAWNFGPRDQDVQPVEWIAKELAQQWGQPLTIVSPQETQPHEATYLKLDISKATSLLAWHPRLSLQEAIGLIVDWHKAHQQHANMHSFTLAQIQHYQSLI